MASQKEITKLKENLKLPNREGDLSALTSNCAGGSVCRVGTPSEG